MTFQPGCAAGPGRPPGSVSGRRQALQVLDDILADQSCKDALRDALQKEFDKNPVRFFRSLIMPLLPPEQRVTLSHEMGAVTWQPLMDVVKSQLAQRNPAPSGEKS